MKKKMKKKILARNLVRNTVCGLLCVTSLYGNAQQSLDVVAGNVRYRFSTEATGVMDFNKGNTLSIQDAVIDLKSIDKMEVVKEDAESNTVLVEYASEKATVVIAGNLYNYITATVNGADVNIVQSGDVGDETCGEITYVLQGESADGSFSMSGTYKATLELRGLNLTSSKGAAIDIENGKRISVSAKNGTVNTLADCSGGSQKGALYCKGHLELKGKGVLNVKGNTSHAISAKEYIEMKNCTVNVTGSVKDGINCAQYFQIESGAINITSNGDDGIQVDFKDDVDREKEDTGSIFVKGGVITIDNVTAAGAKGLKCEGDFTITGGEVNIKTSAPGTWDSAKVKTKASSCIGADGNVTISSGKLNLTATGGGGKGISCDGDFVMNDGSLTILTTGGVLAYVNGSVNQNYTGNTDKLNSDYKSSPKGVKVDGDVEIQDGIVTVTTSGNGGEGIESKKTLTISNGTVKVRAKDDAINSSSHMYIKGGTIDVISTGNDGLDSNGNLYIEGGLVMAFGSTAPECGLDANEEEGYTVYFTGGYILAAGGGNSVPTKTGSTQPFVSVNATVSANTTVSIGSTSTTLYSFTIPSDVTSSNSGSSGSRPGGPGGFGGGSSLLISVPGLTSGTSYTVKSGTTSTTGTAKLTGSSSGPGGR